MSLRLTYQDLETAFVRVRNPKYGKPFRFLFDSGFSSIRIYKTKEDMFLVIRAPHRTPTLDTILSRNTRRFAYDILYVAKDNTADIIASPHYHIKTISAFVSAVSNHSIMCQRPAHKPASYPHKKYCIDGVPITSCMRFKNGDWINKPEMKTEKTNEDIKRKVYNHINRWRRKALLSYAIYNTNELIPYSEAYSNKFKTSPQYFVPELLLNNITDKILDGAVDPETLFCVTAFVYKDKLNYRQATTKRPYDAHTYRKTLDKFLKEARYTMLKKAGALATY